MAVIPYYCSSECDLNQTIVLLWDSSLNVSLMKRILGIYERISSKSTSHSEIWIHFASNNIDTIINNVIWQISAEKYLSKFCNRH